MCDAFCLSVFMSESLFNPVTDNFFRSRIQPKNLGSIQFFTLNFYSASTGLPGATTSFVGALAIWHPAFVLPWFNPLEGSCNYLYRQV
jgi:hypothetical protein